MDICYKDAFRPSLFHVCLHIYKEPSRAGTTKFPGLCLSGSLSFPRSVDLYYRLQTQASGCFPVYVEINKFPPLSHVSKAVRIK
jgi:hypothetical protein